MILQSLEALDRELREGIFHPVYLVLGPEEYQCRQAIQTLKGRIVSPEALAFDYAEFTAGDVPANHIIEAANTFPMLSKRRLVLVNQAEKLEDDEDTVLASLKTISPRSTLILSATELDHRKKFYKTLREVSCVAEFPKLKDAALEQWGEAYVKKQGYHISSASIKKVTALAGSDLQSLAMELDKLLLFSGDVKTIPDSAVDNLVQMNREQKIFDLTDAVGRRDRNNALKSLANLMSMGEHPLYIVTMLARHCRQVLIAQECLQEGRPAHEIGPLAQIPNFKLQEFLRGARSTSPDAIRKMFVKLADIDRQLKSSNADGRMLLENLICAFV